MRRSERDHLFFFTPPRSSSDRPARYKLPTQSIKLSRRTSPIWAKNTVASHWPVVIFAIAALVLFFVSLTHASPPLSQGARPLALGGAYVAEAGDTYSLFYNPAGLSEVSQADMSIDYGRSFSEGEAAISEFNAIYATPYRYKDKFVPLAFGLYTMSPARGAHIVDVTAGGGADAPIDRWTKGLIKFPVRLGGAVTLRQQQGSEKSTDIGDSSLGLGLTGGLFVPVNRQTSVGFALRDLYLGNANKAGPSMNLGVVHRYHDYLNLFGELEYGSGGVWKVKPGLEWLFQRGVVRPRIGWGFHDNGGIDLVATGIGLYISPLQIDIAYLIPTKTLNDNAGQFRASLSYRFGRPQFSEIYYDRALEQASQLDQSVLTMSVKEAELKASLAEIEQKKRLSADELESIKSRIKALSSQDLLGERDTKIQSLKARLQQAENELSMYRNEAERARQRRATVRTHVVQAGDTLQSLAQQYYGDPNQWKKIYNANEDKIERGLPKVGATLVIP